MITETKTATGINALINIPEGDAAKEKMPLLVFLHGIGENADRIAGTSNDLQAVLRYGPLRQLKDGIDIGPEKNWLVIHPQNPSDDFHPNETDSVIEHCKANYPVDLDRIYLMGCSNGGTGVWYYVQREPLVKKIAAFVPICGGWNEPSLAKVLVDEGIPGWAAHAKNDPTVRYEVTRRMVDVVNTLAGRSQILFSEYGMFGHSAWSYFLKPEYGVYDWLSLQKLSNRRRVEGTLNLKVNFSEMKGFSVEPQV